MSDWVLTSSQAAGSLRFQMKHGALLLRARRTVAEQNTTASQSVNLLREERTGQCYGLLKPIGAAIGDEGAVVRVHDVFPLPLGIEREDRCERTGLQTWKGSMAPESCPIWSEPGVWFVTQMREVYQGKTKKFG